MLHKTTIPLLVTLLLGSCGAYRYTHDLALDESFSKHTLEHDYAFQVDAPAEQTTLQIEVETDRGRASWRLLDPDGKTRSEGESLPGTAVKSAHKLKAAPGTWTLEWRLSRFTGSYRIELRAFGG